MTHSEVECALLEFGLWPEKVEMLLDKYEPEYLARFIRAIDYLGSYKSAQKLGFLPAHICAEIRKGHVPRRT